MTGESAELEIESLEELTGPSASNRLAPLLPEYLAGRRWFRSKARSIDAISVDDVVSMPGLPVRIFVLRVSYAGGDHDHYLLPLSWAEEDNGEREEVVARFRTANGGRALLYSALSDQPFRDALLQAIACNQTIGGGRGTFHAQRTGALKLECGPNAPVWSSFVSRAEQSNTSIVYPDQFILKLFRKLEAGINPDLEIGRFLTGHGFAHSPLVLGSLEYKFEGAQDRYAAGILQQFVPNQGDAWKYTIDSLSEFFTRALQSQNTLGTAGTLHPLDAMQSEVAPAVRVLAGSYLDSAELLGKRTAELHAALASSHSDPDFAPEPYDENSKHALERDMAAQADNTFDVLHAKAAGLQGGENAAVAQEVIGREPQIRARFSELRDFPISTLRIRHHGDYHLGQVLYTGRDFQIIDFEGEPARPLAERRSKTFAMRDVAGMVRSFQYAAYAALFGQVPGVEIEPGTRRQVELAAAAWNNAVVAVYLKGYFDQAGHAPFAPSSHEERRVLLDVFLLQKALYEVAYELNNRPDWVLIPLRGILSLIQ